MYNKGAILNPVPENQVGKTIKQLSGYHAYFPHKLAEKGPVGIRSDLEMMNLLSDASRLLGELNGLSNLLKNPNLFIAFYVKKEALLSSQIEGTQCSLEDILQFEEGKTQVKPVDEVVNHIKAMNYGLKKIKGLPFSIRLIKEIHTVLLSDVRGGQKSSGEFKKTQNWIGSPGSQINEAIFIPVPPDDTLGYMSDLEKYYHEKNGNPLLIKAAILHSYFETIHPFNDGNGRLGRLLITFLLCEKQILHAPLLYLSLFLKKHRSDYFRLLMDVRLKGDWNEWIKFFLRGIRETSLEAVDTANQLYHFIEDKRKIITEELRGLSYSHFIYDILCKEPLISISKISQKYNIPYPTVQRTVKTLQKKGLVSLKDSTQGKGTLVSMDEYINILKKGTE